MQKFRYLDVSGVGNAGKSAIVDLLREYETQIWAPHFQFEFDLMRVPGGLIDLRYALVENWSQIRSDYAVKRFKKIAKMMGGNGKRKNFYDLAFSYGTSYQIHFNYKFHKHTQSFVDNFILAEYKAYWPYLMLDDNFILRFFKKFCLKFKLQKKLLSNVSLITSENFDQLAYKYLNALYSEIVEENDNCPKTVLLLNSLEPFNPQPALDMLEGAKSIIVVRDPRDIYVSGMNAFTMKSVDKKLMAVDNDGVNKSFLGADDINIFIQRMSLYLSKIANENDRIKIIRFEDLILNYDETKQEIESFLGFNESDHTEKGKFLNPELSKKNIGAWKKYSKQEEIKYIEEQMKEFEWVFQK